MASALATKPRLLIADDHPELLDEVASLLGADFELVGKARDGASLLAIAAGLKPDVVVTDFAMPRVNGIEAGRRLIEQDLCQAVVLLTIYPEPHLIQQALAAGIRGYVSKVKAGEDLVPAIWEALRGRTFVSS